MFHARAGLKARLFVLALLAGAVLAVTAVHGSMQKFDRPQPGALSPRNASYDIEVRLDHSARTLTGRETIRWRNISANPTRELQLHLYWNAFRNADSTWMRERRLGGTTAAP